jgi:protein-serine/threonine kinase
VNFRHMKESNSLHLDDQIVGVAGASPNGMPDTPGYDELDATTVVDLFGAFSSVTLHYDGES